MRIRGTKFRSLVIGLALSAVLIGGIVVASMLPGNPGQGVRYLPAGPEPAPPDLTAGSNVNAPGHLLFNGCLVGNDPDSSANKCICIAWGEPTPDYFNDLNCNGVFDSGTETLGLGSGGGGGAVSRIIENADDSGSAFIVRNTAQNTGWRFWADGTGAVMDCFEPGGACDWIINVATGHVFQILLNSVLVEQLTAAGLHTYHGIGRPTGSLNWTAGGMNGDGTQCDGAPTDETIGTYPTQGMRCTMPGTTTDGEIYGVGIPLPGNFDKTGDLRFDVRAYLTIDAGAGTKFGRISIDCTATGETPGTWSTEASLDLVSVVGDVVNDEVHGVAAAVIDTDTGGADCDPGDTLAWRWRICDTGSTGGGCTSSAGFEDNFSTFAMRAEYLKNSRSE